MVRAVFYGLGADGTVGANKNSVKILAEEEGRYAQGYFVYDSHKSGRADRLAFALRSQPRSTAPYLIRSAISWPAISSLPDEDAMWLKLAAPGATFLLNSPYGPEEVWDHLPEIGAGGDHRQGAEFYVIDASGGGARGRAGQRAPTRFCKPAFFALSGVLPRDEAIERIKQAIEKTYARKGRRVVEQNHAAVDGALERLHEGHEVPGKAATSTISSARPSCRTTAPDFVRKVTAHDDGRARATTFP